MLERKRLQEEKELKDAAAQRRKDKEEEKLARERVKAQLEQDKLDKRMKFQAEKAAEQAMVDRAEFGAPSVSALAREELLVAETQVNEARMERGPTEDE